MRSKHKQTRICRTSKKWEKILFSEAIKANPPRPLKKGTLVKFVAMTDLKTFDKKIQGYIVREYKGGAKFKNGDTLMARITPCLENGKTAFVDILNENEIGCGSTEFIVLSGMEGKTTNEFVYYLAISPKIRQKTIKSMTGTSGRQRVEARVFNKITVDLPPLSTQRAIAKILSDLDDKIELNRRMNKTLESIAQTIFKRWFVEFEFPGHEKRKLVSGLPEGWRKGTLGEIITIESGKRPGEKSEIKTSGFSVPLIGASSVMGYVKDVLYKEPILIIGRVGTHGVVRRVSWPSFPTDNTLVIRSNYFEYVYQVLKAIDYESLNVGTTQPLITQTAIKKYDVLVPHVDLLEKFEACIFGLFKKIVINGQENESLIGIRDSLLPRLMIGKIRVQR